MRPESKTAKTLRLIDEAKDCLLKASAALIDPYSGPDTRTNIGFALAHAGAAMVKLIESSDEDTLDEAVSWVRQMVRP